MVGDAALVPVPGLFIRAGVAVGAAGRWAGRRGLVLLQPPQLAVAGGAQAEVDDRAARSVRDQPTIERGDRSPFGRTHAASRIWPGPPPEPATGAVDRDRRRSQPDKGRVRGERDSRDLD